MDLIMQHSKESLWSVDLKTRLAIHALVHSSTGLELSHLISFTLVQNPVRPNY